MFEDLDEDDFEKEKNGEFYYTARKFDMILPNSYFNGGSEQGIVVFLYTNSFLNYLQYAFYASIAIAIVFTVVGVVLVVYVSRTEARAQAPVIDGEHVGSEAGSSSNLHGNGNVSLKSLNAPPPDALQSTTKTAIEMSNKISQPKRQHNQDEREDSASIHTDIDDDEEVDDSKVVLDAMERKKEQEDKLKALGSFGMKLEQDVQSNTSHTSRTHARGASIFAAARVETQLQMEKREERLGKFSRMLNTPKGAISKLIRISQCCLIVTIFSIYFIWVVAVSQSYSRLIEDVMVKEEYMHVQDRVLQLFESSEMIRDVIRDRYDRDDMILNEYSGETVDGVPVNFDAFFSGLMHTFIDTDGHYLQSFIYQGTPFGELYGANNVPDTTSNELFIGLRDETTDWEYRNYFTNGTQYSTNKLYDPRCRSWYRNALQYTFSGTGMQAFPGSDSDNNISNISISRGSWDEFMMENEDTDAESYDTNDCRDARAIYQDIFGVDGTENNTEAVTKDLVWSRYVFASTGAVGITASTTIVDDSGNLVAVVAIDYTLDVLSLFLSESIDEEDWISWIFEVNDTLMVASSDGEVTTTTTTLDGCLQIQNDDAEQVAYDALDHPNATIQLMSEIVVEVDGIDSLPINGTESKTIDVTIDQPLIEAGRVEYYPGGDIGIEWVLVKAINIIDLSNAVADDEMFTLLLSGLLLAWILFFLRVVRRSIDAGFVAQQAARSPFDIKDNVEDIVKDASSAVWDKKTKDYQGVITMSKAKEFMSKRAIEHIVQKDESEDKMILFDECGLEKMQAWKLQWFVSIFSHRLYSVVIQINILGHILSTLGEPATTDKLRRNGLKEGIIYVDILCISIEWIDLIIQFALRYVRFSVRREDELRKIQLGDDDEDRDYTQFWNTNSNIVKVFVGPSKRRFTNLILVNIIVLVNFLLTITIRVGIFS